MDWTSITVAVVTAGVTTAGTVTAAVIARQARNVGNTNAERLERIEAHTDPRQKRLIEAAVHKVAEEYPHLISEALAEEFVGTVLQAILDGSLQPRRRRDDDSGGV